MRYLIVVGNSSSKNCLQFYNGCRDRAIYINTIEIREEFSTMHKYACTVDKKAMGIYWNIFNNGTRIQTVRGFSWRSMQIHVENRTIQLIENSRPTLFTEPSVLDHTIRWLKVCHERHNNGRVVTRQKVLIVHGNINNVCRVEFIIRRRHLWRVGGRFSRHTVPTLFQPPFSCLSPSESTISCDSFHA